MFSRGKKSKPSQEDTDVSPFDEEFKLPPVKSSKQSSSVLDPAYSDVFEVDDNSSISKDSSNPYEALIEGLEQMSNDESSKKQKPAEIAKILGFVTPDGEEGAGKLKVRKMLLLAIALVIVALAGVVVGIVSQPEETEAQALIFPDTPTASQAPSFSPTSFPTGLPSPSPTKNPSTSPTKSPTKFPTKQPTRNPTSFPTRSPVTTPPTPPTASPTRFPTVSPTNSPTNYPTVSPTVSPTLFPTNSPTLYPTLFPTNAPTHYPTTAAPTTFPTDTDF